MTLFAWIVVWLAEEFANTITPLELIVSPPEFWTAAAAGINVFDFAGLPDANV